MKISFSSIPLTLLVAFLFISPLTTTAQIPGLGIFFQAIARDKMDNPAKYRKIYIQTSIIQSSNSIGSYLTEIHQSTTDANGIFNISIGQGKQTSGTSNDLLSIPWSKGPLLLNLKIAIEPLTPLTNWDYTNEWIDLGTTPFGTVPYALSAGNTSTIADINKVNLKDSNLIYATPYQLSLKTFDTSFLSNSISNKLNISDTNKMLSPYSKQNQVINALALKLNIADTLSLSNRINSKLNTADTSNMLKNYTIASKLSSLAFTGNYNDLINKPATIGNIVNTVNSLTGDVIIDKNTIGFGLVDNTSDANKPISILTNDALTKKVDKSSINTANGIPSLDASTKIPSNLLPAISFTTVLVANSSTQMQNIGTNALKGTVVVRTDISKTYILATDNSTSLNDWIEILNPGAPVQSVNGKLANVSLTSSDIMEGSNEYFTQSKARLSISANTPINYNAASGLLSADTSTSNYGLVTQYALQQINNLNTTNLNRKVNITDTSSMLLPYAKTIAVKKYIDSVSDVLNSNIIASNNGIVIPDATTNTKGILKLAGDLTGTANAPTIADGVVTNNKIATGISASKVGLGNVNNTADLSKPISTLTQDALNLKLNSTDTATMLSNYLTNMHTTKNAIDSKLNKTDTAAMLSNYLNNMHTTNNELDTKLNKTDTAAMLSNYLTNIHTTKNLIDTKLNKSDTATMLSNYLTYMHTTKNAIDTKLNKSDTATMLSNYLTNMHTTKNAIDSKLNKTDTAAMLSNYLTYMHTTKNLIDAKLNKSDTAAMLSNYLTYMHTTKNLIDTKLNKSDTTAMLSNYLTYMHTTKNALDTKELTANKSNDATLGGSSPSTSLYPTQSAVKQYITNNASAGTTSSTNNWSVLGNAGMVDGTNFMGTTDAQPLNFVANNISSGRIDVVAASGQTTLGYGAGASTSKNTSNSYGTKNTSIGYQTLYNTVYGKENTAMGYQALYNNYTASGSTAIGYQAMYNAYNIATAISFNTYNTAIGYQALLGSSTPANNNGRQNTAIGHQTLRSNSSGTENTAIGYIALYMNTTGQGNTALGSTSLYSNTTGVYNTALSYGLINNDVGSYNTSVGYNALGSSASGSNNTGVGFNADVTGNATNSTALGNGASISTSNTIQLGNGSVTNVNTAGVYATSNTTESTNKSTGALIISGGAGIAKNLNVGGNIAAIEVGMKHIKGISSNPTYLTGDGAGTTASATVTGTDLGGNISVTTSAGLLANQTIITIGYVNIYTTKPSVIISPANAITASLTGSMAVWVNSNAGYFSIMSNTSGLFSNTTYSWNYIVVQ